MDPEEATTDPLTQVDLGDPVGTEPPDPVRPGALRALVAAIAVVVVVLALRPGQGSPASVEAASTTLPTTTSQVEPPASTSSPTTTGDIGDSSALGTRVDAVLWVGGDAPIARIDPNDGTATVLDVRGYPLVSVGRRVIYGDLANGDYRVIDDSALDADPSPITAGDGFRVDLIAPSATSGTVWVAERGDETTQWQLLSLDTNAPVRAVTTKSIRTTRVSPRLELARPPLIDEAEPGVFVSPMRDGEVIFRGSILADGDTQLLVETCDTTCTVRWLDALEAKLGPPIARPDGLLDRNEVHASGTVIHVRSEDLLQSNFVGVESGNILDTSFRTSDRPFAITADGEWAAMTGSRRLWLVELSTGREVSLSDIDGVIGTAASAVFASN